jgi:hypothetical protein
MKFLSIARIALKKTESIKQITKDVLCNLYFKNIKKHAYIIAFCEIKNIFFLKQIFYKCNEVFFTQKEIKDLNSLLGLIYK